MSPKAFRTALFSNGWVELRHMTSDSIFPTMSGYGSLILPLDQIALDGYVNGVTKSFQLNLTEMPCLRCSSIDGSADWLAESGTVAAGRDLMRLMKQTPETRQEYSLLNPARTSACAAGGRSHLGCFSEPIAAKWYYCPTEPGALRVTPIGVSQMMHPDICPAKVARLLEAQRNQTNDQANRTSYIL